MFSGRPLHQQEAAKSAAVTGNFSSIEEAKAFLTAHAKHGGKKSKKEKKEKSGKKAKHKHDKKKDKSKGH